MKNQAVSEEPYVAVAPMMDWTDRHCRYFHRLISPHTRLFTEMVTTGALIHGDRDRFLRFDAAEHPVALQLGGDDPAAMAESAKMGEDYGYDEININCGCPSDRVQRGNFGACLMASPDTVARCVEKMRDAVSIPVTVKCRIGIDNCEDFPFLNKFVSTVSQAGCEEFIIHARKAWLDGLSPKENRTVPPLRYDILGEIKATHPSLKIILNGGLESIDKIRKYTTNFDGVMIGRAAYHSPYFLADIERKIFGRRTILTREAVARRMIPYIQKQNKDHGTPVKTITRHMVGLYRGIAGAKLWRRYLSENAHRDPGDASVIEEALQKLAQHSHNKTDKAA